MCNIWFLKEMANKPSINLPIQTNPSNDCETETFQKKPSPLINEPFSDCLDCLQKKQNSTVCYEEMTADGYKKNVLFQDI